MKMADSTQLGDLISDDEKAATAAIDLTFRSTQRSIAFATLVDHIVTELICKFKRWDPLSPDEIYTIRVSF